MERKGKQKKTARNVIIILCVVLVAVSIPVIMALRKSHSQPTPAETTPTPTAPPAEETVSATPSIELPPYGGYSFDNDELVQLSDCAFVGDSICSGLFVYDVLPKDMVVATGNVGIRSLREYTFDINGGTYTALEALKVIDPKYVIFSMGMNDINMTSEETYCQNYLSFLADRRGQAPRGRPALSQTQKKKGRAPFLFLLPGGAHKGVDKRAQRHYNRHIPKIKALEVTLCRDHRDAGGSAMRRRSIPSARRDMRRRFPFC